MRDREPTATERVCFDKRSALGPGLHDWYYDDPDGTPWMLEVTENWFATHIAKRDLSSIWQPMTRPWFLPYVPKSALLKARATTGPQNRSQHTGGCKWRLAPPHRRNASRAPKRRGPGTRPGWARRSSPRHEYGWVRSTGNPQVRLTWGLVLLPRLVSIQIFEIQSLAGCRLPHGGSRGRRNSLPWVGKATREGFLTYGSVAYGCVGKRSSTKGKS